MACECTAVDARFDDDDVDDDDDDDGRRRGTRDVALTVVALIIITERARRNRVVVINDVSLTTEVNKKATRDIWKTSPHSATTTSLID